MGKADTENKQGTLVYDETGTCDQGTASERLFEISAEINGVSCFLETLAEINKKYVCCDIQEVIGSISAHLKRISNEIATM